ncbi:MAG: hypothetical protein ABSB71_13290 [Candidatus Bathyarchaeia archaeon]|jgi:hypothetical protein
MVHKRSKDKLLKRQIRRIIYASSFDDRIICETISQVSREEVLPLLAQPVRLSDVPDVEKGEVLVNSYGQGSFQR